MTLDEIRPFGDRLLVRPDSKYPHTEGGLHIPGAVLADNPNYYTVSGEVVQVGDGYREDVYECLNHQCGYQSRRTVGEYCPVCKATQRLAYADSGVHGFDVAVGDRVLFGRFAGRQIRVEPSAAGPAETLLIMREVEVLGVLTTDARVTPGYEAARWHTPTKGLTPAVPNVSR